MQINKKMLLMDLSTAIDALNNHFKDKENLSISADDVSDIKFVIRCKDSNFPDHPASTHGIKVTILPEIQQ